MDELKKWIEKKGKQRAFSFFLHFIVFCLCYQQESEDSDEGEEEGPGNDAEATNGTAEEVPSSSNQISKTNGEK